MRTIPRSRGASSLPECLRNRGENRLEQWILEFLRQGQAGKSAETKKLRGPFEVPIVKSGKDNPLPRLDAR